MSRVLPEKLTSLQLVKKLCEFYGIRMFITAFTKAHLLPLPLPGTRSNQRPPAHFFKAHFNTTLQFKPRSSKLSLSLMFPHQTPLCASPLAHTCHMPRPSHFSGFDHPNNRVCPTRFRTRYFFNNYNTNEDSATKFEQDYVRCVKNEVDCVCSPLQISLQYPH